MRVLLSLLLVLCLCGSTIAQPPWVDRPVKPPLSGPIKPEVDRHMPMPPYLDRGPRGPQDPFRGRGLSDNFGKDKVFNHHFGYGKQKGKHQGYKHYDKKPFEKQKFRGNHKICPFCKQEIR